MKPHLAITQLKQLTNSYLSTYFALCSPVDYFEASPQTSYHFNHKDFSILFLLTKRYCLKTLTVFCTSTCTGASDSGYTHSSSKLRIRKRNYIYSFILLYSLQVKSLKVEVSQNKHTNTHTHTLSCSSLRGNWVLKEKNYLVMTTQ